MFEPYKSLKLFMFLDQVMKEKRIAGLFTFRYGRKVMRITLYRTHKMTK
jgi:hypothetical protein